MDKHEKENERKSFILFVIVCIRESWFEFRREKERRFLLDQRKIDGKEIFSSCHHWISQKLESRGDDARIRGITIEYQRMKSCAIRAKDSSERTGEMKNSNRILVWTPQMLLDGTFVQVCPAFTSASAFSRPNPNLKVIIAPWTIMMSSDMLSRRHVEKMTGYRRWSSLLDLCQHELEGFSSYCHDGSCSWLLTLSWTRAPLHSFSILCFQPEEGTLMWMLSNAKSGKRDHQEGREDSWIQTCTSLQVTFWLKQHEGENKK